MTRALRRTTRILLLLLVPLLGGCAGLGEYFADRGRDLGDCVRGSAGLGYGLYAEAEATALVHPCAGIGDVSYTPKQTLRWDPRPLPPGRVRTAAFPTLLVGWPIYRAELRSMGYEDTMPGWRGFFAPFFLMGNEYVSGRSHSLLGGHLLLRDPLLEPPPPETRAERLSRWSWFGGSATAGFVTIDAGVNPLEFVDFLLGWFGVDLLGDDKRGSPTEALGERSHGARDRLRDAPSAFIE